MSKEENITNPTVRTIRIVVHEDEDITLLSALAEVMKIHKERLGTQQGRYAAVAWFASRYGPNDQLLEDPSV